MVEQVNCPVKWDVELSKGFDAEERKENAPFVGLVRGHFEIEVPFQNESMGLIMQVCLLLGDKDGLLVYDEEDEDACVILTGARHVDESDPRWGVVIGDDAPKWDAEFRELMKEVFADRSDVTVGFTDILPMRVVMYDSFRSPRFMVRADYAGWLVDAPFSQATLDGQTDLLECDISAVPGFETQEVYSFISALVQAVSPHMLIAGVHS